MTIRLEHPFKSRCFNLDELLKDCQKLSTFCSRLEKQSVLYPDRYKTNDYLGDGFEFLVEALIKLSPIDNRIGVTDYKLVQKTDDTGVDGYGVGINGKPATVQVKFRSKTDTVLTANQSHLSNFVMSSLLKFNVDKEDVNNMLIITTADGLHHFTKDTMFDGKVRCIGNNELRQLIDNNILFWDHFRNLCK